MPNETDNLNLCLKDLQDSTVNKQTVIKMMKNSVIISYSRIYFAECNTCPMRPINFDDFLKFLVKHKVITRN